ncbi:MAG: carboxypeptidase regulatory-like domain-containing protein [Verrucomicrobiota bacterium]
MLRQILAVCAASTLVGVWARAQAPDTNTAEINCGGTVTDAAGTPVANAEVAYWRYEEWMNRIAAKERITTGTNGAFELRVSRAVGFLVARKPGWAPGWAALGQPGVSGQETNQHLVLTAPAALAGSLVDESNQPVANAEVFAAAAFRETSQGEGGNGPDYLIGKPARDCFAARTDAAGHFRIENFPTNATAALLIRSPGKALRQWGHESLNLNSLPWRAGQNDIKLIAEPAGAVEGKVVAERGKEPVPIASLKLQSEGSGFFEPGEVEPVQSGSDGVFRMSDVAAGSYRLRATFGTNELPDWVAETVRVSVESGQTSRGIEVKALRGGFLEATVLKKNERTPLPHISVNAHKEGFQGVATSDSNGVALLRLPPGSYNVMAFRGSTFSSGQVAAEVAASQTNRVEIEVTAPKMIAGVVRGTNGQPVAGVAVGIIGRGGPNASAAKTDANGKFEMEWNPRQFGQNDMTDCLLVRDEARNLAAAQDIDEDTGQTDLTLAPAVTLAGRVECSGKSLTNAFATLIFWTGRSGMHLTGLSRGTNVPGHFEIPALPPGRKYGVLISAPGYGQKSMYDVGASDAGRMELDPVELRPANLKLAGQVLDADDKPAGGVYVNLQGEGQPFAHVQADREGRFVFEHVCEGTAQLFANSSGSYGNLSAEGGDTNVVVRLGQTYNSAPGASAHKLQGTVTDAGGKPAAGAQVAVFPTSFNGIRWVKTGTNGAFNLTWSLQPWQLQSGGAMLVVRDTARNLAASQELAEDTTNLDVQLKPGLIVAGRVEDVDGAPLAGAQVGVWLKAGNSYDQLNEQPVAADAQGRYEIKCLPPEARYTVFATAKGRGRSQQQVQNDSDTNRMELTPFALKLANRVVAGQVLNENDKPASGVNVSLNGEDQPDGNMTTDSKGRFHFQVCEGQVRLFANSQGGSAQASAEAGDTNIVMTLSSQQGVFAQPQRHVSLKGSPLPDLATVNLASDATPPGKPVLLCLFDAGQRPSRHFIHLLDEQAAALRQKDVSILGVQSAITSDENFNAWKSAGPVSFPVGRVTEKSGKTKWATEVAALPWLILADANHQVVAEGFSLDELDAQIQKLGK